MTLIPLRGELICKWSCYCTRNDGEMSPFDGILFCVIIGKCVPPSFLALCCLEASTLQSWQERPRSILSQRPRTGRATKRTATCNHDFMSLLIRHIQLSRKSQLAREAAWTSLLPSSLAKSSDRAPYILFENENEKNCHFSIPQPIRTSSLPNTTLILLPWAATVASSSVAAAYSGSSQNALASFTLGKSAVMIKL